MVNKMNKCVRNIVDAVHNFMLTKNEFTMKLMLYGGLLWQNT